MTEQEWLASTDVGPMLPLARARGSPRKLGLFLAALGRRHSSVVDRWGAWPVLELVERFADGGSTEGELMQQVTRFLASHGGVALIHSLHQGMTADMVQRGVLRVLGGEQDGPAHAELLRDIVGNPFRPPSLAPAWLEFQEGLVPSLARVAYEERDLPAGTLDPARLAVLGDALEEAGCSRAEVLGHLHEPGPHVRGCWVVDLCLGAS